MAYNTNNPVGSTDPRDLYDNAGNLDKFVNGDAPFYADRFGQQRLSYAGMQQEFQSAQEGRGAAFDQFLEASAFIWIGDYGAGLTFTSRSQYTVRDGYAYRLAESTVIPYTSTGNWALENSKFSLFNTDDILRQDLAGEDGSSRIGHGALEVKDALARGFPLPSEPVTDLIIIYGQSNSVGWAQNTPGYPSVVTEWALAFNPTNDTLVRVPKALVSSAGQESTGHGWAKFANEYVRLTGRKCVLASCGLGGLSIASLSKPGTTYTAMQRAISSCKAAMATAGISLGKTYAVFNQGEADLNQKTSKLDYKLALVSMINNMKADLALDAFFIQLCGSPRSGYGNEGQLSVIHLSQREVCLEQPDTYLASDSSSTFTVANGLMQPSDGVHYTQEGYNRLGAETARAIADVSNGVGSRSDNSRKEYGAIAGGSRRRWYSIYARIRKESTGFILLDESNSTNKFALAFADTVATDATSVKIGFTCNNYFVAGESAPISHQQSARLNISATYEKATVDPALLKTGIVITFNARLSLLVSASGVIRSLRNVASTNALITGNVSATVSGENVTLTLSGIEGFPKVQPYGAGQAIMTGATLTTVTIKFPAGSTYAVVEVDALGINPNTIPEGCEFGFGLVAGNVGD